MTSITPPSRRLTVGLPALLLVIGAAAIALGNLFYGPLNQDEGWYLYAAKLLRQGLLPYRDYFFTQGPVMPFVYGTAAPLWEPFGVLGGRVLTLVLGFAAAAFASLLAGRSWVVRLTVFALLACNVYHSYFTVIPKTYALAALLLAAAFYCLTRLKQHSAWAIPCGLLLAIAAGTRLSLGIALPITGLWLLCNNKHYPKAWLYFGIAGALGLLMLLCVIMKLDYANFCFAQQFHGQRADGGLFFAIGSLVRILRGHLALVLLACFWYAAIRCSNGTAEKQPLRQIFSTLPALLLCVWAGVFLLQLCAPYPYDDYQTPVMPLLVTALVGLLYREDAYACSRLGLWPVLLVCGLTAAASPLVQDWAVIRQDRFWVVKKSETDLQVLRKTAKFIKPLLGDTNTLLTMDTYLAVEAHCNVPRGMEMGPFCYFPEIEADAAKRHHILNRELALDIIAKSPAPVVAASDYFFALEAPAMTPTEIDGWRWRQIMKAITARYSEYAVVPNFGQQHTTLVIFKAKQAEAAKDD